MSATLLDIDAVRARFSALDRRLAFFDGPGGTQCPDEVIDAIADYLRRDNANIGAPYETSRRTDALVDRARGRAASYLGCTAEEVAFGQSMTALNFLLTRALARELQPGDEVLVTRLDHDANVAPWLALADDLGIVVRFVDVTDELALDLDDLERLLSERTKVVAFPAAANSVGTAPDVRRVVDLAHEAGALAWVDAVHYGPHGRIDVAFANAGFGGARGFKTASPEEWKSMVLTNVYGAALTIRAAYDALPREMQAQLEGLRVHHSIAYSRQTLGFEFSPEDASRLEGAVHPLVRLLPRSGRRSLYLASHASRILDWPIPEGRLLLRDLIEHATQPQFVYRHRWKIGDLVIWDNRATMHRARPFDDQTHRRELRRVTTLDIEPAGRT